MGELLALASALTFSFSSIIDKFLTRRLAPFSLTTLISLGAAIFMLAVMFGSGKAGEIPDVPITSIVMSISGGVLSLGIGYSLYLYFLTSVDVSKTAAISQGIFSMLAILSGLVFLGDDFSPLVLAGIPAIMIGLYALSLSQRGDTTSTEAPWLGFKGMLFMGLVASFWVAGFSLQKKALEDLPAVVANGLRLPVVFLVVAAISSFGFSRTLINPREEEFKVTDQASAPVRRGEERSSVAGSNPTDMGAISIPTVVTPGLEGPGLSHHRLMKESRKILSFFLPILNGAFGFGIGSLLFLMALDRSDFAVTMVLGNTSLLFIVIFSSFFLRERVTRRTVAGVVVTMVGIVLLVL